MMVGPEVCICIPFVQVENLQNPNLQSSNSEDALKAYMHASIVAFSSVRRFNPQVSLQFVTNKLPESVYSDHFRRLEVEVRLIEFRHSPPPGFTDRFSGSLFLLDALDDASSQITVLMDPDILCIKSLSQLVENAEAGVGALTINYPATHDINGLSRQAAGGLHGLLGEVRSDPEHFGGEVYVLHASQLTRLRQRCEVAWQFSLSQHAKGLPKFQTEEHLLSFALAGLPIVSIETFVRRIWTAHRLRQVDGREGDLLLWHLPAEKTRGFARLYQQVVDENSWFWTSSDAEFVDRAGRAMGLHHRSLWRIALDTAGHIRHELRHPRSSGTDLR